MADRIDQAVIDGFAANRDSFARTWIEIGLVVTNLMALTRTGGPGALVEAIRGEQAPAPAAKGSQK